MPEGTEVRKDTNAVMYGHGGTCAVCKRDWHDGSCVPKATVATEADAKGCVPHQLINCSECRKADLIKTQRDEIERLRAENRLLRQDAEEADATFEGLLRND